MLDLAFRMLLDFAARSCAHASVPGRQLGGGPEAEAA
jgi:hypothetical protein